MVPAGGPSSTLGQMSTGCKEHDDELRPYRVLVRYAVLAPWLRNTPTTVNARIVRATTIFVAVSGGMVMTKVPILQSALI